MMLNVFQETYHIPCRGLLYFTLILNINLILMNLDDTLIKKRGFKRKGQHYVYGITNTEDLKL
jgi:hypothetical protein